MPILKRSENVDDEKSLNTEVILANEVLKEAGLVKNSSDELDDGMTALLDEVGLGLKDNVKSLKTIIDYSDNESIRLSALRTSLELHGVLGKKDQNSDRPINIIIQGSESANLQLNSIFNPQRAK